MITNQEGVTGFTQQSWGADVATQQLSPSPRTEANVCCLSVKTLHIQGNEIKNPHPCSQEKSLEELLAFSIMIHKKNYKWLQKVYCLVHPYEHYVIHLDQINYMEGNWLLRSDHMRETGKVLYMHFLRHTHNKYRWMRKPRHKEID